MQSPSNYHIQLEGVSDEPLQHIRIGLLVVQRGALFEESIQQQVDEAVGSSQQSLEQSINFHFPSSMQIHPHPHCQPTGSQPEPPSALT